MPSKIEWTDATWNVTAGCTKCSPGCENCYAERMARRLRSICKSMMDGRNQQYLGKVDDNGNWTGNIECCDWLLDIPLHWRKPRRIFVCSMSDLFHPKVPFYFQSKVMDVIQQCPQHTFLILTKRPQNANLFFGGTSGMGLSAPPLPNVHLGVSISTYLEMWKADVLEEIPAAVRYISLEPLLEDVPIDVKELDWVIVGCESGPKRRPCEIKWVESIVDRCKATSVPVFVKQININGKVVKMPKGFPQEYPS